MRAWLESEWMLWVSRVLVAAVFILYGATKIANPESLARDVYNYRLIPVAFVNIIAITLPWIEVLAGFALLTRRWMPGGALLSGAMLLMFIVAIGSALARGLDISCGCISVSAEATVFNTLRWTLVQDIVLLVLVAHIWWRMEREPDVYAPAISEMPRS